MRIEPIVRLTIATTTVSEANQRENHYVKAKRVAGHRGAAHWAIVAAREQVAKLELPVTIVLVRCAPRRLDSDNLASSLKATRDGLTDGLKKLIGKRCEFKGDDGDPRLTWLYGQREASKGSESVEVRIYPRGCVRRRLERVLPVTESVDADAVRWLLSKEIELDALLVTEVA